MSIERLVEIHEPDTGWRHLWTGSCVARGKKFDLHVCRAVEGGQLRIYVFTNGEFVAYLFDPKHVATCAHDSEIEKQNVDDLISTATEDINENALGMY
ncbi:MAG TPA: hypothetical protein VMV48_03845 [Gallionellaceae bacterium]|nr:hypothetical protein [Gallionellaceae bacterium]